MIAANVSEHVANDAECGDHGNSVRGAGRSDHQQDGKRNNAAQHQASRPIIGARIREDLVAASDRQNRRPAAKTIAGPEGRLP